MGLMAWHIPFVRNTRWIGNVVVNCVLNTRRHWFSVAFTSNTKDIRCVPVKQQISFHPNSHLLDRSVGEWAFTGNIRQHERPGRCCNRYTHRERETTCTMGRSSTLGAALSHAVAVSRLSNSLSAILASILARNRHPNFFPFQLPVLAALLGTSKGC